MQERGEQVRIVFEGEGPWELYELVRAFEGLAVAFRETLERHGFDRREARNVRLLVTRIESGSIIANILPGIELLGSMLPMMEHTNVVADFATRIRDVLLYFTGSMVSAPDDVTVRELRAIGDIVRPVARRADGAFELRYERPDGPKVEFRFDGPELARAELRMDEARERLAAESRETPQRLERVLLYLHQASRDEGQPPGRRTGDRGVIEEVTTKPLPVHFAPEAGQLKDEMVGREENPFRLGFVVDADVQTRGGKPALYVVRRIHEVIPLDDAEDDRSENGA